MSLPSIKILVNLRFKFEEVTAVQFCRKTNELLLKLLMQVDTILDITSLFLFPELELV